MLTKMALSVLWTHANTTKKPTDKSINTQDPTLQHNRMVNQTIERFKNENLKKLQMV